jgi:hypothetical protein
MYTFKKTVIGDMFKCYSVNHLNINGENKLIYAGEGPGICAVYDRDEAFTQHVLWDKEFGGTMSVVPVEGKEGYFYISKGFYSMVDSEPSSVNLVKYEDGKFTDKIVCHIPYLHRFGILKGYKEFLIGCSIATHKYDKQDWDYPGRIYVGELAEDLDGDVKIPLKIIKEGLTQNHGFTKGTYKGMDAAFIGAKEGYYAVCAPQAEGDEWLVEQILDMPISDAVFIDLDGDGVEEIVGFTPFHGDELVILKLIDGKYQPVFKDETDMEFYHAIDTYELGGKPTVFVGARRNDMSLVYIQYNDETKEYDVVTIDENVGPSNVHVFTDNGKLTIMSANRQINQAAFYVLED